MVSRIPPEWLLFALKKELSWLFVGGLITPVFSYISSYGFLCHHAQSYLRFAFVFVVDLAELLSRKSTLPRLQSVRSPTWGSSFFFEECVILGVVELIAMHLLLYTL